MDIKKYKLKTGLFVGTNGKAYVYSLYERKYFLWCIPYWKDTMIVANDREQIDEAIKRLEDAEKN